jgi:hypothetical protein
LQARASQDNGREHVKFPADQRVGYDLFNPVRLATAVDRETFSRRKEDDRFGGDFAISPSLIR